MQVGGWGNPRGKPECVEIARAAHCSRDPANFARQLQRKRLRTSCRRCWAVQQLNGGRHCRLRRLRSFGGL
eukprot:925070-Lingulodinium_polyedra.AAC.1